MDLVSLRKRLSFDALIFLSVIALLLCLNIFLYIKSSGDRSTFDKLTQETSTLEANVQKSKENIKVASKLIDKYSQIPPRQMIRETTVIDDEITTRIREAKRNLQEMKELYKLKEIDISITPPKETDDIRYKRSGYIANVSSVTLKFSGMTDEILISSIIDLMNNLEGYISIKSIEMDRTSEFTPEVLNQIRANNVPALAKIIITFDWVKILKKIEKAAPAATTVAPVVPIEVTPPAEVVPVNPLPVEPAPTVPAPESTTVVPPPTEAPVVPSPAVPIQNSNIGETVPVNPPVTPEASAPPAAPVEVPVPAPQAETIPPIEPVVPTPSPEGANATN